MSLCLCGVESFGLSGCYWCLKQRVDWSQRPPSPDGLNERERAFIGLSVHRPRRDGWHSAGEWARRLDLDLDMDPERCALLRILAGLGDKDEVPSV